MPLLTFVRSCLIGYVAAILLVTTSTKFCSVDAFTQNPSQRFVGRFGLGIGPYVRGGYVCHKYGL